MICAVEFGTIIQGPINQDNGQPHQFGSNKEFVIALLIDCIKTLFQNLNKVQIETFVWKLFNTCTSWQEFKSNLRDLLISMKSFSSSNDEFYEEEKIVSTFQLLNIFYLGCFRGVKAQRPIKAPGYPWDAQDQRIVRTSSWTYKWILASRSPLADNATTITLSVNLIVKRSRTTF